MFRSLAKNIFHTSGTTYKFISFWYNYKETGYVPRKIDAIEKILENLSKAYSEINFLQIGSNDGISGDPLNFFINNYNWKGVLVEPIPFLFKQLQLNYAHRKDRLTFLNVAVGEKDKAEMIIYVFDEKFKGQIPDWYYQLGSFYKDVIYKHDIPNVDHYIIEKKVPLQTIQTIIEASPSGKNIELLHIDTEGYDFEILKTVNFSELLPKVILVEYIHLNETNIKQMISLLKINGFAVYRCNQDFIGIQNSVHKKLMTGTRIFPFWEF